MNNRDFDYIEARLLVPDIGAFEAHSRLIAVGEIEIAARLMTAMQEFNDKCRAIRYSVHDAQRESRTPRTIAR
jgi:hypothetical protein